MELIDLVPEFNLYEEYWKIYTRNSTLPPQYVAADSVVEKSIIGEGTSIYGKVYSSVIGCNVTIEEGAVVSNSIIFDNTVVKKNCKIDKSIIAEDVVLGEGVTLGIGDAVPNETDPHIYSDGIVTIGEHSVIPDGVSIGKNTMVVGVTDKSDYVDGILPSGRTLNKAGE